MRRSYFNSTHIRGQMLSEYEIKARSQNKQTLEFFEHHPYGVFTSEDINDLVMPGAPETSPRRALTWLKTEGLLQQVGQMKGKYGRPIFTYRLTKREPEQQQLI